ncbi:MULTISPECIES: hypothetical protein [unclassified Pseudoalteromonas]|uniref:hypothetical protein n=1 Tax=unclassified Pseudoalteromonas TaxID=194690 RepID=UPI0020980010|nr:hypothetical protein [Pseudoalteromonas sp. XMcav2-N]MCO7190220.1 hypothetical protein [Pseudoalteromonas sp. XMcav2-N]
MSNSQTMSLDQRIAALQQTNGELVASNNTLTQTVTGKMGAINATVASAEARMDQAIANLAASHSDMRINYYDRLVHSKSSLEIQAEEGQEHISKWKKVPVTTGCYQYPSVGSLTRAHFTNSYMKEPGYYEKPVQYDQDWSVTQMQFVLANEKATSEQINQMLDEQGSVLLKTGYWDATPRMLTIPCISISGLHPYLVLFVRFINSNSTQISDPRPLQNITQFGYATFAVDRVVNYPHIKV